MFITFLVVASSILINWALRCSLKLSGLHFATPSKKRVLLVLLRNSKSVAFFFAPLDFLENPKKLQLHTAKELHPSHHGTFCGLHQEYYSCIHLYRVGLLTPGSFQKKKSINKNRMVLLMEEIQTTTWDVLKNLINNGINYIPQLVSRISSIKSMTQTFPDWCRTSYEIICLTMVHKPKHITNRRIKHRKIPKITTYIYYICKSILQKLWISWLIADLTVASFLPMVFTLPETNSEFTPENGWLEYTIISFWDGPFSSWPYP